MKNYKDIVITQADKGSAVVVLDLFIDKEEAYRQLNDLAVYESVESDPSPTVFSLICDKLKVLHHSNLIDTKCFDYLKDCKVNLGKFNLLPTIHSV